MGPDKCRGVVRLDGVRNFGGDRNLPPGEDASHRAAGDILQSAVAHSCGVSTVVEGYVGGFTSGKHHLVVFVGDIADRRCAVGIRVCKLFLQTQASSTCYVSAGARNRVFSFIEKT